MKMKQQLGLIEKYRPLWEGGKSVEQYNIKIGFKIRVFVVTQITAERQKNPNLFSQSEINQLTEMIMDLNQDKTTIPIDQQNCTLEEYQQFLRDFFSKVDYEDRYGTVTVKTSSKFRLMSSFIDVLSTWGPIDEEMIKCKKYCQYKAVDIYNALKRGEIPKRGGPKEQINNENINNNNIIINYPNNQNNNVNIKVNHQKNHQVLYKNKSHNNIMYKINQNYNNTNIQNKTIHNNTERNYYNIKQTNMKSNNNNIIVIDNNYTKNNNKTIDNDNCIYLRTEDNSINNIINNFCNNQIKQDKSNRNNYFISVNNIPQNYHKHREYSKSPNNIIATHYLNDNNGNYNNNQINTNINQKSQIFYQKINYTNKQQKGKNEPINNYNNNHHHHQQNINRTNEINEQYVNKTPSKNNFNKSNLNITQTIIQKQDNIKPSYNNINQKYQNTDNSNILNGNLIQSYYNDITQNIKSNNQALRQQRTITPSQLSHNHKNNKNMNNTTSQIMGMIPSQYIYSNSNHKTKYQNMIAPSQIQYDNNINQNLLNNKSYNNAVQMKNDLKNMNVNYKKKSLVCASNDGNINKRTFKGKYELTINIPVKYDTVDYYMLVENVRINNENALKSLKRSKAADILNLVLDSLDFLSYVHK